MTVFKEFQSTIWTVIRRAKDQDGESLSLLLQRYRAPVLGYLRKRGFDEHDAEDIVQDVFLKFLKGGVLAKVEREKGRFRDMLLAVTKNTVNEHLRKQLALKRGGGAAMRSLDEQIGGDSRELSFGDVIPESDIREFDAAWVESILSGAFEKLREECAREKTLYYEVLSRFLAGTTRYEDLAAEFRIKASDVRNYLHYGRLKLKRHIRFLVKDHSLSREDFENELGLFAGILE
ncbi:MAG: sigma-70 family RNA polymerase sigma factor [Planctomycetota bacterium]|nr:sigma-70 family RNA polymerase sigma factor [Planctomycetota bacterium]